MDNVYFCEVDVKKCIFVVFYVEVELRVELSFNQEDIYIIIESFIIIVGRFGIVERVLSFEMFVLDYIFIYIVQFLQGFVFNVIVLFLFDKEFFLLCGYVSID